jgi:hypothetical protein
MTNQVLRTALACARLGWPVFPCQPGRKTPATPHGYLDATTDPAQLGEWFTRHPDRNIAVATGFPGPDVLDIDYHGPAGSGFPALTRLRDADLLDGAAARVRTPSGGLHVYFAGTRQRSAHLPACHVDFLAAGGYVLIPPSNVSGRPYQPAGTLGGRGALDWAAAARLLEPSRQHQRTAPETDGSAAGHKITALATWVAVQREGNRNAGLFWAANRALDADKTADLSPLAVAASQAGLDENEITRTLDSARRLSQARPQQPSRQAEGPS